MEKICQNCKLFDEAKSVCSVQLVILGEILRNIPVNPKDKCLWESISNPETGECLADHIKQVRFRPLNPIDDKTSLVENKIVVEYENDFFKRS